MAKQRFPNNKIRRSLNVNKPGSKPMNTVSAQGGGLHSLLNVQGAAKGGGTLRAYDVGGRIYWFIEGYDPPSLNPANLRGAIQL
jgi:hypothetical protein